MLLSETLPNKKKIKACPHQETISEKPIYLKNNFKNKINKKPTWKEQQNNFKKIKLSTLKS